MTRHLDDALLASLAFDDLAPDERSETEAHLAACADCRAKAGDWEDTAATLALAEVPVAPLDTTRVRVLDTVDAPTRFAPLAERFAALLDLGLASANRLLLSIDRPEGWLPGPGVGSWVMHLITGPSSAAVNAGFVKVAAGRRFPWHRHLGREQVLILEGALRDADGTVARAGDLVEMPAQSAHDFEVLGEQDLIYAVVLFGGVEFGIPFEL